MQKYRINLLVLSAIVILSALAARGFLKAPAGNPLVMLEADLKQCFRAVWQVEPQTEVLGAPEAANVRLQAPAPLRLRKQQWGYPLIDFVARRHPEVKVSRAEVLHQGANVPPLAPAPANRNAFSDPSYFEAARSELMQRNAQRALGQKYGAGHFLVLVDVTAASIDANQASPEMKLRRRAEPMSDSLAPEAESMPGGGAPRRMPHAAGGVEAVLVCIEPPSEQVQQEVRQALEGHSARIVVLPHAMTSR